jgi:hypothetical protein
MTINNVEKYTQANTQEIYADYSFGGSAFSNPDARNYSDRLNGILPTKYNDVLTKVYYIPLSSVRDTISLAEATVYSVKDSIENGLLRKIFVSPYLDKDLEQAHFRIWEELSKIVFPNKNKDIAVEQVDIIEDGIITIMPVDYAEEGDDSLDDDDYVSILPVYNNDGVIPITLDKIGKDTPPTYICFDEIDFAERLQSTAARQLLTEYYEAINSSTFSYFYQLRNLLNLLLHELACIKQSLVLDFGEDYESESQQQVALQYDSWGKMAIHYSKRITKTISARTEQLPSTEMDKVSKKQAAKFQAFFAVRLSAVDSEINDILSSLKRDLIDNCDIFYTRFVSPAINLTKNIADPLEFDFITTKFVKDFPNLAGELVVATNVLKGNFISVHADLLERTEMMTQRVDGLFQLIHEKKKYANFISQLGNKAVKKKQILVPVDYDLFSSFFRQAVVDSSIGSSLKSEHAFLDGLDDDSHPQYLLKDGGTITGSITVADGGTVDGIVPRKHKHDGTDGSTRISGLDIDFSFRDKSKISDLAIKPLSVKLEGFVSDVLTGGVPVFDAILAIEVDDLAVQGYEYEVLYTEIG